MTFQGISSSSSSSNDNDFNSNPSDSELSKPSINNHGGDSHVQTRSTKHKEREIHFYVIRDPVAREK